MQIAWPFINNMLTGAARHGLTAQQAYTRASIPLTLLEQQAPLDNEQHVKLMRAITLGLDDELFGLAHRRQPIGTLAMICAYASHGGDLKTALGRTCEGFHLLDNSFTCILTETKDSFVLQIGRISDRQLINELPIETILMVLHRFVCWLGDVHIPILSISLDYTKPSQSESYRDMFLHSPIIYDAEYNQLELPKVALDKQIVRTEQEAMNWARRTPEGIYLPLAKTRGLALDVCLEIEKILTQEHLWPHMQQVADRLGMPEYSLRRRLKQAGFDYIQLRNQVRQDLVIKLLNNTQLSIEQIADQTGFSEASALVRAFKSWTGMPPNQYRQRA